MTITQVGQILSLLFVLVFASYESGLKHEHSESGFSAQYTRRQGATRDQNDSA